MRRDGPWLRAAQGAGLLSPSGELQGTVFGEMSELARTTGSVNLGQGFPDYSGPQELLDEAIDAISRGENQYPPPRGTADLRAAIAEHQLRFRGVSLDPDREVLVTVGATEALAATVLGLVEPGEDIVVLEPHYDAYGALAHLADARLVTVPLRWPEFQPDHDELRRAVTDRTRLIIVNTPHNPTGAVLRSETLQLIVELAARHDAIIVTDEVYEHLVFDGQHVAIASLPGAASRTLSIGSAGKTFSVTGWKVGWVTGPAVLIDAVLAVKQYLSYVGSGPFQPAVAAGLRLPAARFDQERDRLRHKRDLLVSALRSRGLETATPAAGYFAIADAASIGYTDATELCRRLPREIGVVGIPVAALCTPERQGDYRSLVRFAFCKSDQILEEGMRRLDRLSELGR
jgi:N-succinyldiaminopimelate aminotransferase